MWKFFKDLLVFISVILGVIVAFSYIKFTEKVSMIETAITNECQSPEDFTNGVCFPKNDFVKVVIKEDGSNEVIWENL